MSFDILFMSCNFTSEFEERISLFTRKPMKIRVNQGLTADERAAVIQLLAERKATENDGFYHIPIRGGGILELSADGLVGNEPFTNCMVHLRGLNTEVAEFLFELSRRGNMLVDASQEEPDTMATAPEQLKNLPPEVPVARLISSATELHDAISAGFGHWGQVRDAIVRGGGKKKPKKKK